MGLRFIFMLTRNDRTVGDASEQLKTALRLGVRHIGFKDIGLPIDRLKVLNRVIKADGATSYLEVVSLDRQSEIVSAKAAVQPCAEEGRCGRTVATPARAKASALRCCSSK